MIFLLEKTIAIVEKVGPEHIKAFITDSASAAKACGQGLQDKYPSILWMPCKVLTASTCCWRTSSNRAAHAKAIDTIPWMWQQMEEPAGDVEAEEGEVDEASESEHGISLDSDVSLEEASADGSEVETP